MISDDKAQSPYEVVVIPETDYHDPVTAADLPHAISFFIEDSEGDIYSGDNMEEVLYAVARDYNFAKTTADGLRNFQLKAVVRLTIRPEAVIRRVRQLNQERNAKSSAEALEAWNKELATLMASIDEYSLAGFNKRWQELQNRKPWQP